MRGRTQFPHPGLCLTHQGSMLVASLVYTGVRTPVSKPSLQEFIDSVLCCLRYKNQAQSVWSGAQRPANLHSLLGNLLWEFSCVPQSHHKVVQAQFCTFVVF